MEGKPSFLTKGGYMKCEKCGIELSFKIYKIHVGLCKAEPKATSTEMGEPTVTKEEINYQRELMKAELDAKGIKYALNAKNTYLYKLTQESKEAE